MDFLQLITEHWNILWVLVTVFTGFVLWHMSQRFVSKKDFDAALAELNAQREKQDKALEHLSSSLLKLDATIDNMPNTASLHRLELGLEELRGLQRENSAQLKGQSAALERLNNNFDRLAMGEGLR